MVSPSEVEQFKKENREIIEKGKPFYEKLKGELQKNFPPHYIVIINVDDGTYVVGKDGLEAVQMAEKVFQRGYVCRIDNQPVAEFAGCPR